MRRCFSNGLLGMVLASGAPLGLVALRLGKRRARWTTSNVRAELSLDAAAYAYVTIGTSIAFTGFGLLLGRQADHFEDLSLEDSLTRLRNRRGCWQRLDEEFSRARRHPQPLALLFVDVDGLKQINDRRGHRAGDMALCHVATAIRAELRSTDVAARWGGDEFAIVAPNTSEGAALALGERIRHLIGREGPHGCVTASIGLAVFDPVSALKDVAASDLIALADQALYAAKLRGRDRVSVSPTTACSLPTDGIALRESLVPHSFGAHLLDAD
jgi:diguanylate cyclase (GGDEF)-like protein